MVGGHHAFEDDRFFDRQGRGEQGLVKVEHRKAIRALSQQESEERRTTGLETENQDFHRQPGVLACEPRSPPALVPEARTENR